MAKILVLTDLFLPFPGGAERMISNICDALVDRGHEIHILTSYAKAKAKHPMTIADIGVNERVEEGTRLIELFLCDYQPDVILSHHFFMHAFQKEFTKWSGRFCSYPLIEVVHNRQRHYDAAFAIFNSEWTANKCGFRSSGRVSPNSFEDMSDMILLPPATEECIAPTHGDAILMMKPLEGKGVKLVYALAKKMPERQFVILRGEWQDCEYIEQHPNILFLEPVDDIREFYQLGRILLMPSLSEDAGTGGAEAAMNGIPCISSNVGGLPETNKGGLVMLEPNDVDEWTSAIWAMDDCMLYDDVVNRQRSYVESLNFPARFDEIDQKVRALCATK